MNRIVYDALAGAREGMLLPGAVVLIAAGFGWLVFLAFQTRRRF